MDRCARLSCGAQLLHNAPKLAALSLLAVAGSGAPVLGLTPH